MHTEYSVVCLTQYAVLMYALLSMPYSMPYSVCLTHYAVLMYAL